METFLQPTPTLHYDLYLEIQPETRFLSVHGNLTYRSTTANVGKIRILLHSQFESISFSGRRVAGFKHHQDQESPLPFIPAAGAVELDFNPPLSTGESAVIQFAYQGVITAWPDNSCNVIEPDWVELGFYLPWYPLIWDAAQSVTFNLQVLCPPGFQVAGYGDFRQAGNAWECHWVHPTQDIVVVASPVGLQPGGPGHARKTGAARDLVL